VRPQLLTLAILVAVSVCVTVVGLSIDVKVTPTAAAAMRPTPPNPLEGWASLGAGLSWLVTFGAAVGLGVRWVTNRKRTRTEERP
jgi:hypothetical protein